MSDDLTARVTAVLDWAEQLAREADNRENDWWWSTTTAESAAERHIAGQSPQHVLALVAAHREIVELCEAAIERAKPATPIEHRARREIERDEALGRQARIILALVANAHRIEARSAQAGTDIPVDAAFEGGEGR